MDFLNPSLASHKTVPSVGSGVNSANPANVMAQNSIVDGVYVVPDPPRYNNAPRIPGSPNASNSNVAKHGTDFTG